MIRFCWVQIRPAVLALAATAGFGGMPSATAADSPPPAPGAAYFARSGTGVVQLEGGKFSIASGEPKQPKTLALGPDGTLWIASIGAVHKLGGGAVQKLGDIRNPGSLDHIAVAADGKLWGVSYKGIHVYDGQAWTLEDKSVLGPEVKLLNDIAIDSRGRIWIVSSNALHLREGEAWRSIDLASVQAGGRQIFFKQLASGADGKVYASHSAGLLECDGASLRAVDTGSRPGLMDELAVGPDGRIHVQKGRGELLLLSPSGGTEEYSAKKGSFAAQAIEALSVDAAGRTWLSTDNGIVIVEPGGKAVEWVSGSVPELAGAIKDIVVAGAGPELPMGSSAEVAKGGVTGKLVRAGSALEGVEIEICAKPKWVFQSSPCAEAPFHKSTKTDAQGVFSFTEVPLGTYRFGIFLDGKWRVTPRDCCQGMQEGKSYDLGAIDLSD